MFPYSPKHFQEAPFSLVHPTLLSFFGEPLLGWFQGKPKGKPPCLAGFLLGQLARPIFQAGGPWHGSEHHQDGGVVGGPEGEAGRGVLRLLVPRGRRGFHQGGGGGVFLHPWNTTRTTPQVMCVAPPHQVGAFVWSKKSCKLPKTAWTLANGLHSLASATDLAYLSKGTRRGHISGNNSSHPAGRQLHSPVDVLSYLRRSKAKPSSICCGICKD